MRAPQIIILCLMALNLLCSAYLHGKPKDGKWNFFVEAAAVGINFGILYWGGFFR